MTIAYKKFLSTTWHIKRDYDPAQSSSLLLPEPELIYDLTYQKGLRLPWQRSWALRASSNLSTTWHIKRDYDLRWGWNKEIRQNNLIYDLTYQKGLRLPSHVYMHLPEFLIYDLTYQKGLRLVKIIASFHVYNPLSTTWHIKRDYDNMNNIAIDTFSFILSTTWHIKRDYDKHACGNLRWVVFNNLSTTWHIKRDYD